MQIIIFLNGSRGLAVLNDLLMSSDVQVSAVVTPPTFGPTSLSSLPKDKNIDYLQFEDVNAEASLVQLKGYHPDAFLIAGYSTIFKPPLLAVPLLGTLNLHAGPLPRYRGGSPLNWQIINGESEAGLSVIQVDEGIDTGAVFAEVNMPIGSRDTIRELHQKANHLFPKLVVEAVEKLKSQGSRGRVQTETHAQYWHQRSDADGHLDFRHMKAIEVDRVIRAITKPYPGAYGYCEEQKVRVLAAEIPQMCVRGNPGRICFIQGKGPYVVCADQAILFTEYKFETLPDRLLTSGQYLT